MELNPLLELPTNIGNILSPTIKIAVSICMLLVTLSMFMKFFQKKNILTRNMTLMLFLYALAPLVTSFDILLGWRDLFSENSYVGIGVGIFLNALGNTLWLWFNQEIFLSDLPKNKKNLRLIIFLGGELFVSLLNLIFRIAGIWIWQIFSIAHAGFCIYLFTQIYGTYKLLIPRVDRQDPNWFRLKHIIKAVYYGLFSIILFVIDSFSLSVTLYSIIGWILLIGMVYHIYRGYI
jgi:hypothetical protein